MAAVASPQCGFANEKSCPFSQEEILSACEIYDTPFYLYNEKGIQETCRKFKNAFRWCSEFINYFAVKACPNPHILNILKEEGFGADCSSLAELVLAESVGYRNDKIMFTSNETPAADFIKAKELNAIINLDDISHIDFLEEVNGELPELICFRYNPGAERCGNSIIGNPVEAKFGCTKQQLFRAYEICKKKGVKRFGLHTMIVSNCLELSELAETARMCFSIALELSEKLDIKLELINLGGGIGVSYNPKDKPINFEQLGQTIQNLYRDIIVANNLADIKICYENGRCILAPHAVLVTRVIHQKNTYKNYLGVDACMANLMRPGMYGAYHHITCIKVPELPQEFLRRRNIFKNNEFNSEDSDKQSGVYDVVGALCENNDKFAVDRYLGEVDIGDILIIYDVGAHGHCMGFNYNGRLRSAEYLKKCNGDIIKIRRAEDLSDYFRTLEWSSLPSQQTVA